MGNRETFWERAFGHLGVPKAEPTHLIPSIHQVLQRFVRAVTTASTILVSSLQLHDRRLLPCPIALCFHRETNHKFLSPHRKENLYIQVYRVKEKPNVAILCAAKSDKHLYEIPPLLRNQSSAQHSTAMPSRTRTLYLHPQSPLEHGRITKPRREGDLCCEFQFCATRVIVDPEFARTRPMGTPVRGETTWFPAEPGR